MYLWNPFQVPKDLQNFYWMARYQNSELFDTDYLREKELVEFNLGAEPFIVYPISLGYGLLYYSTSFLIDHIWFSKLLIFLLLPVCLIFLFKIVEIKGTQLSSISLGFIT